nr:hypothetical protein BaRGS_021778 [Batillaria attramentaria]
MRFPWRLLKPRRSCLIVLGVAIVTVMWMVTFDSSHQPQTAGLLIHLYNGHGPASLESKRRTLVVPPVPTNASKYEPPPAPDSARRADSPESLWEELGNRRRKVEETCDRLHHRGTVRGVFVNADRQLAYCFVPKTGCTFWKQVFAFLNNDTGLKTPVTSPFQIPRLHVHLSASANGKPWRSVQKQVEHYHRFMFTRDPYTRLWSAYIDKFLLPDFWKLFGTTILAQRRPLPSKKEIACGMGVNFTEFVKFSLKTWEPHWVPVSSFCDPCQFRPQIVGKMETYTRDARAALGQVDLDWILEGVDHHKHVRNELEMLVEYNFQVIHKKSPMLARECITEEQLGARLWTAFQYNAQ